MTKKINLVEKSIKKITDGLNDLYSFGLAEKSFLESYPGSIYFFADSLPPNPERFCPSLIYLPGNMLYVLLSNKNKQYDEGDLGRFYMKIWQDYQTQNLKDCL